MCGHMVVWTDNYCDVKNGVYSIPSYMLQWSPSTAASAVQLYLIQISRLESEKGENRKSVLASCTAWLFIQTIKMFDTNTKCTTSLYIHIHSLSLVQCVSSFVHTKGITCVAVSWKVFPLKQESVPELQTKSRLFVIIGKHLHAVKYQHFLAKSYMRRSIPLAYLHALHFLSIKTRSWGT